MLTDASLLAAVDATLGARPVDTDDVLLTPFPLCHVAGYNALVLHRRARPIVLQPTFEAPGLARLVRDHGVTMLSLAPTMIAMLLDHPDVRDTDLATVRARWATGPRRSPARSCGASSAVGLGLLAGLRDDRAVGQRDLPRPRGAPLRRRVATRLLLAAAGRPAPGVEVRSATRSELLVRAPQVMRGYWNDPQATAHAIDPEGWLHTGDVARVDADGIVSIVDRTKDIIVSGGENIASREVEEVLHGHPAVRDVAVVGRPDPRWGEVVTAVVVTRAPVTAAALIAHCREQLAGFKSPRSVEFVDELPRTASGKVRKHELRAGLDAAGAG